MKKTTNSILKGVNRLADTVKLTLGTKGRTVLFNDESGRTHITKDGVTVAKNIISHDDYENMIITVLREASLKTMKSSGDGPQPLWSKILTPNGFTTMSEIKVGDSICGINETTQTVTGIFPKGKKEIYKVYYSDGRVVECCEDHLWSVYEGYKSNSRLKTMTTKEMIDSGKIYIKKSNGYGQYGYYTPRTKVEFSKKDLTLHPYIVGCLIGDGSLHSNGSIELAIASNQQYIIDKIEFLLPEGYELNTKFVKDKNYFRVKIKRSNNNVDTFHNLVKELGLLDTYSHSKFIPTNYLYSTIEDREELLEGLVDTDGHVNTRGFIEYSTVSDRLKDDFLTLMRSLGYAAHYKLHTRENDVNSYSNKPIHRIIQLKGYKYGNQIRKIEATGEFTEMQCIKVSNDDHLYITDDFIVTHNTTTTMILAQYLINEGVRLLDEGVSYYELSKQIDQAVKDVTDYIKDTSIDVSSEPELLREIASISSNDEELGDYIYSIIEDIGLYGHIEVKESEHSEIKTDKTKGMKLYKGWIENFMINNKRNLTFEIDDCYILIIDDVLQAMTDISSYVEYLGGKPLLVFCNDITDITLSQIKRWLEATGYPACFVQNDGYGERKSILMNDLAALTSAYVIGSQDKFDPDNLGFAKKVKVDELYTSVLEGDSDQELIDDIIFEVKQILQDDADNDEHNLSGVDKVFHRKRLANLTGGVAVIYAGGHTKMEMKELKDRLDDAVLAVESSIRQGVNVGGGNTFINCQNKLKTDKKGRGYSLVIDSLSSPFKQLLINADLYNNYDYYKNCLLKGKAIDLRNNKVYKLKDANYTVYDPSSVLIDSLTNASAVAKSLLSIKEVLYNGIKLND